MGIETEVKLGMLGPSKAEMIFSSFGEPELDPIDMETTYYDTENGLLDARKVALRRRMENGTPVWTLKAPAGIGRFEWEIATDSMDEALDTLERESKVPLKHLELKEICGARFLRRTMIHEGEGFKAEISYDRGTVYGNGLNDVICELEIELKEGSSDKLIHFADSVSVKYFLNYINETKSQRAKALLKKEIAE